MFDFLGDLFSKIWEFIKENWLIILIIILIIIAIFFPAVWLIILEIAYTVWGWVLLAAEGIATFFAGLGIEGAIAAALGIGILVDPEGVGEFFGNIIGGVGEAAGSVLGSILDSPIGTAALVAGGAALLFWLVGDDDDGNSAQSTPYQSPFMLAYNSEPEEVQQRAPSLDQSSTSESGDVQIDDLGNDETIWRTT